MPERRADAVPAWCRASFADCVVDRPARELTRAGAAQRLDGATFDLLVHLIDGRGGVCLRDDLVDAVFTDRGDSALAQSVMRLRQALGDTDRARPLIKTLHRVGYRFMAEVSFSTQPHAPAPPLRAGRAAPQARLAVLPFRNDTGERSLGWVGLGLQSMLAKALEGLPAWSLVPVADVIAIFGALADTPADHAAPGALPASVEASFGTRSCVIGRLAGKRGAFVLEFDFHTPTGDVLHGAVAGHDPVQMIGDAAQRLRRWMQPDDAAMPQVIDLGDGFLHEACALAWHRSREARFLEAERLLSLLDEAADEPPALLLLRTQVAVLLGRRAAPAAVARLEQVALQRQDGPLQATSLALRATLQEQRGEVATAGVTMQRAAALAAQHGLVDDAVKWTLDAAHHLANAFDPGAAALLAHAYSRAERLGNRVLLSQAHWVSGKLAGLANDWATACQHHELAVTLLKALGAPEQFAPSSILAWSRAQLGALQEATDSACAACDGAARSGREPEHGLTVGAAAYLCFADRRIGSLMAILRALPHPADDRSVSMTVARELHGHATMLGLAGRYDEALQRIDAAAQAAGHHPLLHDRCHTARLHWLVKARRHDDVAEACHALRSRRAGAVDPRLQPWIDRALALAAVHGSSTPLRGLQALEHLVATTPACEARALAGIEAAWLRLERGERDAAQRLAGTLGQWLQQSPAGLLLDARLRHAAGDVAEARRLQSLYLQRYVDTVGAWDKALLDAYARPPTGAALADIAPLDEPIDLHWQVHPVWRDQIVAWLARHTPAAPPSLVERQGADGINPAVMAGVSPRPRRR